jgi:L-glyceraldehyde 3-phosphate reductase
MLASLDQSLERMGLEYVDIFYSHRADPDTPLEETMGALATAVAQGKALYAGISSYSPERTAEAAAILRDMGTPLLIHQPSYSLLNRWIEDGLLDTLEEVGAGCITFSPLAQGLLTDKYLDGIPEGSRASQKGGSLSPEQLSDETLARVRALNEIARGRGQSLAQMALAWTRRAARGEHCRTRPARFHARGARRDRPLRGRQLHQPVGPLERRVTPGPVPAGLAASDVRRAWRGTNDRLSAFR